MHRRSYVKETAGIATVLITGIAGCSGGGGASGEVVENTFDNITVQSHRLENTTALGTDAVATIVTVENVGDAAVEVGLEVTLYDGSDTVIASPNDFTSGESVQAGASKELSVPYKGRKGDVARYEMRLVEPDI